MTQYEDVGAIVGQGTIAGALVSQGVIDANFPPGGGDELIYGSVPLAPFIFMDDVIHGAETIEDARRANTRMDRTVRQLNLTLNRDKSVCLVIGSIKQRTRVKQALLKDPLMCGEFETQLKDKFKWLVQILSCRGLGDSVAETVASREGKIRGTCLEIAQIVNDWRSKVVGGMETAILLWEACCIPSLLSGAGTWTEITTTTEKKLSKLQCWYFKLVLQVSQGAPSASLLWDLAALDMSLRVYKEKILFVLHLRNLENTTLAGQVFEEQKENNWPGLSEETRLICEKLHIEDCNITQKCKSKYVKMVNFALHQKNEENLRVLAKGKCERFISEEYGRKEYISKKNIFEVRNQYKSRFGLLSFAGNYQHDARFAKSNWLCHCEESREDESHLRSGLCKVYGDIAERFSDLTEDESLVQFFAAVLTRRDQLDKFIQTPDGGNSTIVGANCVL